MRERRFVLVTILALAAVLRVCALAAPVPLGNEYFYWYLSLHPQGIGEFLRGILRDNALHLLVDQGVYYAVARFSDAPGWLRAPDVLWGCLGVLGLWRIAERAGDGRRALLAALL